MNNDDGFGSGNLRELYKLLKANGHNGLFTLTLTKMFPSNTTELTRGTSLDRRAGHPAERGRRQLRLHGPGQPDGQLAI
jgi:hypothetical protein